MAGYRTDTGFVSTKMDASVLSFTLLHQQFTLIIRAFQLHCLYLDR